MKPAATIQTTGSVAAAVAARRGNVARVDRARTAAARSMASRSPGERSTMPTSVRFAIQHGNGSSGRLSWARKRAGLEAVAAAANAAPTINAACSTPAGNVSARSGTKQSLPKRQIRPTPAKPANRTTIPSTGRSWPTAIPAPVSPTGSVAAGIAAMRKSAAPRAPAARAGARSMAGTSLTASSTRTMSARSAIQPSAPLTGHPHQKSRFAQITRASAATSSAVSPSAARAIPVAPVRRSAGSAEATDA